MKLAIKILENEIKLRKEIIDKLQKKPIGKFELKEINNALEEIELIRDSVFYLEVI